MLLAIMRNGKWERTDRLDRLCWRLGTTFISLNRRLDYFRDRWFPRAEATDIALEAYPAKKGTAKPAEKAQGEVAPTVREPVEGAEAVASDAPAVKGKVRVAERLDAAALNQAKPHELVGDAGLIATEDEAFVRGANPPEQ